MINLKEITEQLQAINGVWHRASEAVLAIREHDCESPSHAADLKTFGRCADCFYMEDEDYDTRN